MNNETDWREIIGIINFCLDGGELVITDEPCREEKC